VREQEGITVDLGGEATRDHAVGPSTPAKWGAVLQACVDATPGAKLEWVPAKWLEENGAGGEDAFPIWIAPVGKYAGFHRWNNDRAEKAGLKFRPVLDTVKAINAWYPKEIERRTRVTRELVEAAKAKGGEGPKGDGSELRAGPPAAREQELLAKWKASTK